MRIFLAFILFVSTLFAQKNPTIEEMIGQMLVVGFHGNSAKDEWTKLIRSQISNGEIGGVILYGYNIKDPMQLSDLTAYIHHSTKNLPVFIAVDQEGGKVSRLTRKKDFSDYPSAKTVAKSSVAHAQGVYRNLACELRGYGINLNFAPVVDLDLAESDSIGALDRSFSDDPKVVSRYAKVFIDMHKSCGITTALKHFVGHGFATDDTHKMSADITNSFDEKELEPFIDLIDSGYSQMIMMSHLIDRSVDTLPMTLSGLHIKRVRDLGFDGVIVSDDMQMKAITESFSFEDSVVLAVSSGVDLMVFSNYFYQDPQIPAKFKEAILNGIKEGIINKEQIEASYKRIKNLKKDR